MPSGKKIRVLIVAGDMHVGGIENQLMHLLRNADKKRFQIDYTSTRPDAFFRREIEALEGGFILIPKMDWKKPWEYCKTMYSIMKNGKYDVVHSHELFHSGITLSIAKMAGVPCRFAHAHNWQDGDGTGKRRSILRSVYNSVMRFLIVRNSTVQIACSSWAGEFLYGKRMLGKPTYHLVHNSVDTAKYLDEFDLKESGEFCDNGWKNVLNVARVTAVKNQKFLVAIAEELRMRNVGIRILCAGSGDEYEAEVRQSIEQKGLGDYIELLGVRSDIDVLMRKCSAFVLPSKYEGMPLVMIEAQASGLPCVSADTYSPEVDFGIGSVKWLSLEAGPTEWADAIQNAVEKPRALKEEVQRVVAARGFDSDTFSKKICGLYDQDFVLYSDVV